MKITYYGHSFFTVGLKQGFTVAMDPFDASVGYPLPDVHAQLVLASHEHFDHNNTGLIKGRRRIIRGPGKFSFGPVEITGIPTFHDPEQGRLRGKNTVYLLKAEGVVFCHCGDLGHLLDDEQLSAVRGTDVLFVPVGGRSTVDAGQAAELCRRIAPKLIVPMHYKTPCLTFELGGLDEFLRAAGLPSRKEKHEFSISRETLPEKPVIVIPDYLGQS
jgi:L-ascorbate metabolism protein UlaG (beta-lactamase superfamily)